MTSDELARIVEAISALPWSAAARDSMGPYDYELSGPDMCVPYCEMNDARAIVALAAVHAVGKEDKNA